MYRQARVGDIPALARIRAAVTENVLRRRLTMDSLVDSLTTHGRGWVCEWQGDVVGFSIATRDHSIWALFVHPDHEGKGIGRALLFRALEWLRAEGARRVWLGTEPGTRAEQLYRRLGWQSVGAMPGGDVRYELDLKRMPDNESEP